MGAVRAPPQAPRKDLVLPTRWGGRVRTRPAGPLPTDPALADPPGKPREAQHRKPPRVGGRAGQPLLGPAAPHPTKDKDRPSPASATPSSPGRHRPPVLSDLDLCPCWSLGRERGSGHPRSKHQTSPNPTSNPGQRLCGPQAQGGLQKRACPRARTQVRLSFSTPWSPAGLGGGGLRPQGAGCWLAPSLGAVGGVGWSGEAVAQAHCPLALLGLPCAARWPLGRWTGRLTLHPSVWSGSGRGPQAGAAPLPSRPPCCPWSPSSARAPRAGPWGSPQWGLCGWGLKALLSQGDVVIRRPGDEG